jgi:hypothetical protein
MRLFLVLACATSLFRCAGEGGGGSVAPPVGGLPDGGTDAGPVDGTPPGWVVVRREDFQRTELGRPSWQPDPIPDDGPFADDGLFFRQRRVVPPAGYRISSPLGDAEWLTIESYTRSSSTPFPSLASAVADPADPENRVLRVSSPAHTDGTVVRSTHPLPERYRLSLRVGFADFGDGKPGLNGYAGGETAEPWWPDDATAQNGFYWLTILDAPPRPHNNTWIHHHRKVVVDSDNNVPPWMEMFDGSSFRYDGQRPIMMFAVDGKGEGTEQTGKPFISYSAGTWQPSGLIRAVDAYLPNEWYRVSIERNESRFTLEISGRFRYGGQTTYRASIDAAASCVFHFNRTPAEDASHCLDESSYPSLGRGFPHWPAGATWPDYFMFGDPHTNYYRGSVLYDDVVLEVWQ